MAASDMNRIEKIIPLCNGERTSGEIADILGERVKYVQRVMKQLDLPRLKQAPRTGENNPAYVSGRRIDRDGYVLVSAPPEHPYSRKRQGRNYGIIYEHRLIMEKTLDRYLDPLEIVDHIDGLRLHNNPSNLRLFSTNGEHLKATISGRVPAWSAEGKRRIPIARHHPERAGQPVHKYGEMKKSGDARLREILLAMIALGTDSPFLSGTTHHLKKAGIVDLSRPSLIRALDDLCLKYA